MSYVDGVGQWPTWTESAKLAGDPKLRDKIRNGKPGFEASVRLFSPIKYYMDMSTSLCHFKHIYGTSSFKKPTCDSSNLQSLRANQSCIASIANGPDPKYCNSQHKSWLGRWSALSPHSIVCWWLSNGQFSCKPHFLKGVACKTKEFERTGHAAITELSLRSVRHG